MVLSEIVFNNSGLNELLAEHPVLFEYVANLSGGLLLKKYDNGRYIRTIEYLNNSDKISGYSQIFASGNSYTATYEYGLYNYISVFSKSDYAENYLYEMLDKNCLKKSTTKSHEGVIDSSTRTVDIFGRTVEYTCPGTILTLTYENGRVVSQKENDSLYTYTYDDAGVLKQASLPSGELITYSENLANSNNISVEENNINSTRSISGNLSIIYNVNEEVGLTDFFDQNGDYSEKSFNCYGYALGRSR